MLRRQTLNHAAFLTGTLVALLAEPSARSADPPKTDAKAKPTTTTRPESEADPTAPARNRMVERHLVERGIKDPRVLEAFRTVPRHKFLPRDIAAAGVR